ncbi:MAG TPA: putative aminohydrolase SsnA [Longilinea sp.]|nr:putative aminohydrolase SsnA [Longilinea sp.]
MLIKNCTLITWGSPNQIIPNQSIRIKAEKLSEIGPADELLPVLNEEVIDAKGQFAMPGNICAHTHFYGAFSRGMAIPGPAPKIFPEILEKLWWPLDKALDLEDVRYSALVCLANAIRHGTTTLIDHHASPNAIDGSLDTIAKSVLESGLRASLCYEVTDRNGLAQAESGIQENLKFIRWLKLQPDLRNVLGATFGLHASLTLSDKTLQKCRDLTPEDVGFHIHVAEHFSDEDDSKAKSGTRVVDRLANFGILGPKTIAVHCVHIDQRETELLRESGTWVTHQPRSNMNNAVGMAAVESMMRAGIKVCLGNDGFSNAMWEEWKAAYFAHKLWHQDPRRLGGYDVVKMAVYNNAELVANQFGGLRAGEIAVGAAADMMLVDYKPITPFTAENLPWHILFGFNESMITTTIARGKVLMLNRELQTLDDEKIAFEARRRASNVWKRYENQFSS